MSRETSRFASIKRCFTGKSLLAMLAVAALVAIVLLAVFGRPEPEPRGPFHVVQKLGEKVVSAPIPPAGPVQPSIAAEDAQNPVVEIITSRGVITCELFARDAPNTVRNFLSLVGKGFYDGLLLRPQPGFVIRGGDPLGNGRGGPGYCIPYEATQRDFTYGVLGMTRSSERNTAGSEFFICVADVDYLRTQYTAFGQVISGRDVLTRIQRNDKTLRVRIVNDGGLKDEPYTLPEQMQ